ncbi:hypothetical protein LguiB_013832 [Lonicera macranthoides]
MLQVWPVMLKLLKMLVFSRRSLDTANKKARGLLDFIDQLEIPLHRTIFIFTSKSLLLLDNMATSIIHHKGFEIHIVNGFSNNSCPLRCRCQSKDTDFGYHELLRGEEFYWKFHNHVFEKTLYFCHFYWGNMDKVFDVFNDRKAFPSCADGITTQEDNDLGNHDLQRNEEFYWKFHIHVFGRTLYFCHFYWGDIDKSVDVFNDKKRFPSCDDDKSPKRPAKPQPRNIYPHGFVSRSSRPASQGVTHPGIALVHYSLNFGVFMGSEATNRRLKSSSSSSSFPHLHQADRSSRRTRFPQIGTQNFKINQSNSLNKALDLYSPNRFSAILERNVTE